MRAQRVLKYLNLLIGLALLAFLAAVYWYAWRPLPKTSGSIEAPVSGAATITRDSLGVPHIRAASIDDALFLQGYVTAQDRLWQMDAIRRLASGQLAEVMGQNAVPLDLEARRLRLRRLAEQHTANLPPQDRRWIDAYCRGVNHFLETRGAALPLEFTLLDYHPRPWTPVDTIAAGLQMYRDLTSSWKIDIAKAAMLARGDPHLVAQLYPPRMGAEVQPGSNAWAISGALTATGKPILANDPHLEWSFPSTWYMIHLEAPGLNVIGTSLPGIPGVIIGHNERIAWGVTNLQYDVQDLYIERLNPQNGQYVAEGRIEQARPERELILVKGGKPVEFTNWITRHGPVWSVTGSQALALRWTAAEPKLFEFPFLELNQARNWEEFRTALRRFHGPGQNFVYADVDGNIGYQATGALPIRRTYDGDVPVDGASGKFEWEGFIPFDELPHAFNPPRGMVITANQNPFPENFPYRVGGDFDPGFRARQIRDMLASSKGWKPEQMLLIQKDVYSPFLHALAGEFVRAAAARRASSAPVAEAVELLRSWNGQMEKSLAAPMIAQQAYFQLRRRLAERASPGGAAAYQNTSAPAAILRLVQTRPPGWFPDWDRVLVESLQSGIEEGRKAQGSDLARWQYGASIALELKHPIFSRIPYLGRYFNVGPVPMSGSATTVKQTSQRLGPSMRFIADASDWLRSCNNITLGQSGQILSSHYKDQWDDYWAARAVRMNWRDVQGDVLRVAPLR